METDQNSAFELKELKGQVAAMFRVLRVMMAFLLLGFAYLNVRATLRIPSMGIVTKDMVVTDENLPAMARFILGHQYAFMALGILLTLAGLVVLFMVKSPARGIIQAAVAGVLLFVLWQVVTSATAWPLVELMNSIDAKPE